jgi:hypothetical protein
MCIVAAMYLGALCGCSSSGSPATTSREISVEEIRDKGVVGLLGLPLGTIVTVSGVAVPNTSLRKADEGEALFLKVVAVDGQPLAKPIEFPFRKAHDTVVASEPVIGKEFSYRGYETGGFEGVPLNYGASWQTMGFHFSDEFLVLADK